MTVHLVEKTPKTWELFFGDEYIKTVSASIVRKADLETLDPHTLEECRHLLYETEKKGAIRFSISALARQSLHSEKLIARLQRHFLSEKLICEVINYCREKHWIDDEAWEARRVQTWHTAGRSSREIAARLGKPTVRLDDREALTMLLQKKHFPHATKKERESTIRRLLRRGFSFELIKEFIIN
jgi:SOS response regulatory protein OraA/RecX